MADAATWDDGEQMIQFLAKQLYQGNCAVFLGAGASADLGLPEWGELVKRVAEATKASLPMGLSNQRQGDVLLEACGGDDVALAREVRQALYRDYTFSLDTLRESRLLSALVALTIPSNRGHVRNVVTLNYDDLLERCLEYYGFDVRSVARVPSWHGRSDVCVFHPHGLLPSESTVMVNAAIVMAQAHYDRIVGRDQPWRSILVNIMQSHTCLFIGLSGDDQNLSSMLEDAARAHVALERGDAFWGVRFGLRGAADGQETWKQKKVYALGVDSYDDIPGWLMRVCQEAATIHKQEAG